MGSLSELTVDHSEYPWARRSSSSVLTVAPETVRRISATALQTRPDQKGAFSRT